jgi:hypothetical protein
VFEVATGGERAAYRHAARIGSLAFHPDGTRLAASSPEAPVYVWDLFGEPTRWDPARADAVWAALGSADAKAAFAAVRTLRAHPAEAVPFLRAQTPPAGGPTAEQVAGWLKRLDAPAFADRERAQKELAGMADLIRPQLEAARKEASAEAAQRLDHVLKAIPEMTPERARYVRAVEVLEAVRSPDAVELIRTWAAGPAGARLTTEAKESLDRLGK